MSSEVPPGRCAEQDKHERASRRGDGEQRELLDVAKVWRGPLAMAHVVKPLKVAQFARPPKTRGARVVTGTVARGSR
ncbi:MAG: hypothetical protein J2O49_11345 [Sciscionella sp.]|nr:hypothetical protein [Sciscionella sp.]